MPFISFGRFSAKSTYPMFTSLFYVLREFSFGYFTSAHKFKCPLLFQLLLMGIGMTLCYFLELVSLFKQSSSHGKTFAISYKESTLQLIKEYKVSLFALLLSVLDAFGVFFLTFLALNKTPFEQHIYITSRLIELFFVSILMYIVMKRVLFFHNYTALVFIIIGLTISIVTLSKVTDEKNPFNTTTICTTIFANFLFCFLECFEKLIMDNHFISHNYLNFLMGLYTTIYSLILNIVGKYITCRKWMYFCTPGLPVMDLGATLTEIFNDGYYIAEVIIFIALTLLYNTFILLVIKAFSPTHRLVTCAFSSVVLVTYNFIFVMTTEDSEGMMVLKYAGQFLLIIGVLIYNEIIIVHFCKMDENTEVNIRERAMNKEEKAVSIVSLYHKKEID